MRILKNFARIAIAVGSLAVGAHAAESAPNVRFDIPAQALETALLAFSQQAHMQIVVANDLAKGIDAPAIQGEYPAVQALTMLLRGSGLEYRVTDERTIAISGGTVSASGDGKSEGMRIAQTDGAARQDAESSNNPGDSADNLEEVVVTAQKRVERLQDVPISISVLGGDELDRSTVDSINEMLNRVPGVSATTTVQGGNAQLSVRGVSAAGPFFSGSSPIGYYLDSVPFALVRTGIAPDANPYDLQRVEVLRGPQGTLYGASALNGVVRVLTKDANLDEFEFKARTSASSTADGGENYRGDVALNVPIIAEKLAARAVVGYQDVGGWIDRPNIGIDDANDAEILSGRLKINAQPTESLSIGFLSWFSRAEFGAPPFGFTDSH